MAKSAGSGARLLGIESQLVGIFRKPATSYCNHSSLLFHCLLRMEKIIRVPTS